MDLHALVRAGLSDRAIQRETGIERRQVARWRAEHGYPAWTAPVPEHGSNARYKRGCRCGECREAHAARNAREHRASGRSTTRGTMSEDRRAMLRARRYADLTATREAATRTMARWTADELAVALDMTLSAREAAERLGRSKSAVEHQRAKRRGERTGVDGPLPRGRRARKRG